MASIMRWRGESRRPFDEGVVLVDVGVVCIALR